MNHKKPPVPVIILLVIAILVGGYYGVKALTSNGETPLLVSGTIEATEITISPEIAGKVAEVFVNEGAVVKAGDPLFRLDDSLLRAQREVTSAGLITAKASSATADAALETARANYNLALNAARLEAASTRTLDWNASSLPGYTLPGGYFTQQSLLDATRKEVETSQTSRDLSADNLAKKLGESSSSDFVTAETNLLAARSAELTAQDVLARARLSSNNELINAAQAAFDSARTEMDSSQSVYDKLKDGEVGKNIISLRLNLSIAQELFEAAQDRLLKLEVGEASPKLLAAKAVQNQAELAATQAESAVSLAEAQLALIDLQIRKLNVVAPADGVILTRSIEPGEMVSATAAALKLGRMNELYIKVYVPEDIYGTLSLGQIATLTVDSYPGESFSARIVNIANQAEFTPRNVQTMEGRKATVFAVKLNVEDLLGKLKPGMPADITFNK